MSSRILVVGHKKLNQLEVGADFYHTLSEASDRVEKQGYDVICLPVSSSNFDQIKGLAEENKKQIPNFQFALIDEGISTDELLELTDNYKVAHVSNEEAESIEDSLLIEMLEQVQSEKQQQSLFQLMSEQQENLLRTEFELSDEFAENQKNLLQAKERLDRTNKRVDTLKRALMIVHNAKSIADIETLLSSALNMAVDLSSVRIVFEDQIDMIERTLENSKQQKIFSTDLSLSHSFQRAKVFFFRSGQKGFGRDEVSFLNQISDGITLAVDRLIKIQKSETLKQQWEITFDAISDGLCLCTKDYRILRTNKSFVSSVGIDFKKLIGKNVFEAFHNINKPENFQAGQRLSYSTDVQIDGDQKSFEITLHPIETGEFLLVAFHDTTSQKRLEKQVFENSKMLELGSISGSIAHELNNPLGGILSFLQLIKMDLKKDEAIYNDVMEMESAANRCKTIVENLLGFSRKHQVDAQDEIDLKEIVDKAIEIQDIKMRYKTTKIQNLLEPGVHAIQGNKNLLIQAIMNLLQNSLEATAEQEDAKITVAGVRKNSLSELVIEDNGPGIPDKNLSKIFNPLFTTKIGGQNNGLGLTVAFMILNEHKSRLEISSKINRGTSAKITFGSLDL